MVQKTKKLLPRVQKHGHWVHLSLLELWWNGVFWFGLETEVFVVSFFFEETNITLEILCMGLCNNEYRHKYSIFQYSVLLLINNSMSLRNGKCFFFLSMTCKETRLYSSGSFRYSIFLVLCLILLDRMHNSPSHLGRNRSQMRNDHKPICHLSVDYEKWLLSEAWTSEDWTHSFSLAEYCLDRAKCFAVIC